MQRKKVISTLAKSFADFDVGTDTITVRRNATARGDVREWAADVTAAIGRFAKESGLTVSSVHVFDRRVAATRVVARFQSASASGPWSHPRFIPLEKLCENEFRTYTIEGDENHGSLTIFMGPYSDESTFLNWQKNVMKRLAEIEKRLGIRFKSGIQTQSGNNPNVAFEYQRK